MNLKKKIWDFFKQEEDLSNPDTRLEVARAITDLNKRVHELESKVGVLIGNVSTYSELKNDLIVLTKKVSDMDYIHSHKFEEINKKIAK